LPPTDTRIVFMRRPVAEIRISLLAFFGSYQAAETPDFDGLMNTVVAILRDRTSFQSVDVVQYHDVLRDPRAVFDDLAAKGWPIDPAKAAAIPDARKARFSGD
jgi:hypothetical protein